MFDIVNDILARMRAQDRFGHSRASLPPEASAGAAAAPAPSWSASAGGAAPGVLSPAAETVLDAPYTGLTPEEEYHQRVAAMNAKAAGGGMSFFERAMARARGEAVDELPITPALGTPAAERPLRDPQEVIAEMMATATTPSTPAPAPEKPYTGLTPEEEYRQRTASMNAKAAGGGMSFYERAMARARGEAVDAPPVAPALGTPATQRPLRDPQDVIAEAMASHTPAPSTPVPAPARPYSGLSAEEEYKMRRAAMDAKDDSYLQQALARHAAR